MVIGPLMVIIGICALVAVLQIPLGGVGIVLLAVVGVYLLWRASLLFGPTKICWRCGGDGHVGGLLGGRRTCGWCDGDGRRPRVGSGK